MEDLAEFYKKAKEMGVKTKKQGDNDSDDKKKKARDMARESYLNKVSKGFKEGY